jgi:hypothetical protein
MAWRAEGRGQSRRLRRPPSANRWTGQPASVRAAAARCDQGANVTARVEDPVARARFGNHLLTVLTAAGKLPPSARCKPRKAVKSQVVPAVWKLKGSKRRLWSHTVDKPGRGWLSRLQRPGRGRAGSDLRINARVLEEDSANAVLFERTVTDTPQSDLVLPNGTGKRIHSEPDLVGTPWPSRVSGYAVFGLWSGNTWRGPQPATEVIDDNPEVWQYESPLLRIQDAVVWNGVRSNYLCILLDGGRDGGETGCYGAPVAD